MSKILVVDDEKSIRITFRIFLSEEGHEVFVAEDAETALKIFNEQDLDLIITDIVLRKMSGLDFIKIVKAENPNIPIVIMTGSPEINTAMEVMKYEASDYIIKPISKEKLLEKVKSILKTFNRGL